MKQKHRIGNAAVDALAKSSANDDRLPVATLKLIATESEKVTNIALWIGRCSYMANHFPDTRGNPEAKPKYLRDSEGLAATRLQKYKARRKRRAPVFPTKPGDLSRCPRWQQLRQRILAKASSARRIEEAVCGKRLHPDLCSDVEAPRG